LRSNLETAGEAHRRQVVRAAITEHGCVGVKICPPNGYLPFGNRNGACGVARGGDPWSDGEALDRSLKDLYEFCDREGVPVMSHASKSMGRDAAHDGLASPCGWQALAVAGDVSLSSLRINAGHFGGDKADDDWTGEFARLMGVHRRLQLLGLFPKTARSPELAARFGAKAHPAHRGFRLARWRVIPRSISR
jgi:hypothetical protein